MRSLLSRRRHDNPAAHSASYFTESLLLQLRQALADSGVDRAELAERLGVRPGRIADLLAHPREITLHQIALLAGAADIRIHITSERLP